MRSTVRKSQNKANNEQSPSFYRGPKTEEKEKKAKSVSFEFGAGDTARKSARGSYVPDPEEQQRRLEWEQKMLESKDQVLNDMR